MDLLSWEGLCDFCIWIMRCGSKDYGVSYGFINIMFFVLLGPLSTIFFAFAYIFERIKKRKLALALAILGALMVLGVLIGVLLCYLSTFKYR